MTRAMNGRDPDYRKTLVCFREDFFAFGNCEHGVGFVFKRKHDQPLIVLSNPPCKRDTRASFNIGQRLLPCSWINRVRNNFKHGAKLTPNRPRQAE